MNCREKWLNLLTICRKAGRMVPGFDPAKEEIVSGRAKGVFITKDISPKTEKEVLFFCGRKNITVTKTDFTMEDIQKAVGRRAGVLAVCDEGFAKSLVRLSAEEEIQEG